MTAFMSAHPWLVTYAALQIGFLIGLGVMALCVTLGQRDDVLRFVRTVDEMSGRGTWN